MSFKYSAKDIGLMMTDRKFAPTDEQVVAIEAPLDEPLLIVAGAGSGKTTTMANRIVWLVANGFVLPEEILGLTFTNKATSELNSRVRSSLTKLANELAKEDQKLNRTLNVNFNYPTISTYNGFATNLVQEYGLFANIDSDLKVLSGADKKLLMQEAVMQIAKDFVDLTLNSDDDNFEGESDGSEDISQFASIAQDVNKALSLADEIGNNLQEIENIEKWINETLEEFNPEEWEMSSRTNAKYQEMKRENPVEKSEIALSDLKKIREKIAARKKYLKYVEKYQELKLENRSIDFSDQIRFAQEIAEKSDDVRAQMRERFKIVILDEFQDTSASQIKLLQTLFGNGHPVTAVGDPNQAIYTWRGASVGGIMRFPKTFTRKDGSLSKIISLSESQRSGENILKVANSVAAPLFEELRRIDGVENSIKELRSAKRNVESPGETEIKLCLQEGESVLEEKIEKQTNENSETVEKLKANFKEEDSLLEVQVVADYIEKNWDPNGENPEKKAKTAVILAAARRDFERFKEELDKRGIPAEIVGLGGLLNLPEICDLISFLTVSIDENRNDQLIRLLKGTFVNISPYQLSLLNKVRESLDSKEKPETLLSLITSSDKNHISKLEKSLNSKTFSAVRLLGSKINQMRSNLGCGVSELVSLGIYLLGIDSEIETLSSLPQELALLDLTAFEQVARDYEQTSIDPDIVKFLEWLKLSKEEDNGLDIPVRNVNKNAVQIATIHSAKGLEWDLVCSVGNTPRQFCNDGAKTTYEKFFDEIETYFNCKNKGWLSSAESLPDELKLENSDLEPLLRLKELKSIYDVDLKWPEFVEGNSQRVFAERRRLAYVAYTRAKQFLLVTASVFSRENQEDLIPTQFFANAWKTKYGSYEKIEKLVEPIFSLAEKGEQAKIVQTTKRDSLVWGDEEKDDVRKEKIKRIASLSKAVSKADYSKDELLKNCEELRILVEEKEKKEEDKKNWIQKTKLPTHLSTSAIVRVIEEGGNHENFKRDLLRRIPQEPQTFNDVGSRFHKWVEQFYLSQNSHAQEHFSDSLPANLTIDKHVEVFLKSKFAKMTPIAVEQEVTFAIQSGRESDDETKSVIARIDAVFAENGCSCFRGGDAKNGDAEKQRKNAHSCQIQIVDWKTGKAPETELEQQKKAAQLAMYRRAWIELNKETDPCKVSAAFFYTKTNKLLEFSAEQLDRIEIAISSELEND